MTKKRKIIIGIVTVIVTLVIVFFPFIKSVTIMFFYSKYEESYSVLKDENIYIHMNGGLSTLEKDWYPFVMTFNDDKGFSSYIGRDVRLSILYNFGAFEYLKGASSYYNEESEFFNGFYGAYVVKDESKAFGYGEDMTPDFDEMVLVPKFDMTFLVLKSIGCNRSQFDYQIDDYYKANEFLGYSDWDVIEASITTNSPMHEYKKNHQAYIQYGKPPETYYKGKNFVETTVKGKIYGKYFEEKDISVFFYVIAPTEEAIAKCDKDFLMTSTLKIGSNN